MQLENALMSHPAVLEAAVFAARHPKWDERPVAAVVLKPGKTATREELAAHLEGHFAKFWMPDTSCSSSRSRAPAPASSSRSRLRDLYGDVLIEK